MTFRIASDELGGVTPSAFAEQVDARIATLREYDDHEATVRRHAADETMKPEQRWTTLAVPQAPAEIDSAIRTTENPDGTHTFAADYEIVAPALDKRKAALTEQVNEAERNAIHAVLPQRKVRAHQLRVEDIRQVDRDRTTAEFEKRKLEKREQEPIDWDQFHRSNRPPADTEFLDAHAAREATLQRIYRWAANLHSEIEDLTEETIDAFEVKPLHAG